MRLRVPVSPTLFIQTSQNCRIVNEVGRCTGLTKLPPDILKQQVVVHEKKIYRFEQKGADKKYTQLIILRCKEAMGDLGCPSKIIEELLTVILCNKVLKRQHSSLSRKIADIFLRSLKNFRLDASPRFHDKK